jgi:hypothetical protein
MSRGREGSEGEGKGGILRTGEGDVRGAGGFGRRWHVGDIDGRGRVVHTLEAGGSRASSEERAGCPAGTWKWGELPSSLSRWEGDARGAP